jgi:hypothetical protein
LGEGKFKCRFISYVLYKSEMAKVYREARSGMRDVQDATKQTWCLQAVAKVIETSDIEQRIEALEQNQK